MKTSPRRRKHRRRAFRRLFWLLVLATLLLLLWPRRVTLDGLNSPHAILLRADSEEVLAEKDADSTIYPASMTNRILGGKTGYTGEAGLCLASLAEVKGREYILVTAGAGGNHSTAPCHIEDAVTVYRRVSRGS